jgi:hypothetical protein
MLSKFKAWDPAAASVNPGDSLQMPLEQAVLEKARALLSNVESLQADLERVIPGDLNAAKLAAGWACSIQELVEPYTVAVFGEPGTGKSTLLAAITGCDVGVEKVDGSMSEGPIADLSGSRLSARFNEYVARRLVVQEVAWHGGSGSAGPVQRYDVSLCVVDGSAALSTPAPADGSGEGVGAAEDEEDEAGLLASMGLPAEVTATMTTQEKQQLVSNLMAAQAEVAATAGVPLWRIPSAEQRETDEASRKGLSMAFIAAARQCVLCRCL